MSEPRPPLVQVGDIVRLPETQYIYGVGDLSMQVTAVGVDPACYPGLEWLGLRGTDTAPDGIHGRTRDVLVRVAALRQIPTAVTRIDGG